MKHPLNTCHVSTGLELFTRHTQIRIVENPSSNLVLIPPSWTHSSCMDALLKWAGTAMMVKNELRILAWAKKLGKCDTRRSFARELDAQLTAAFIGKTCGPTKSLQGLYQDLLIALWSHGCIVWPSDSSVVDWPDHTQPSLMWGTAQATVQKILTDLGDSKPQRLAYRCREFMRLLLSRSVVDDIMSISPRSDTTPLSNALEKQDRSAVAKLIVTLQRQARPNAQHFECRDFTVGTQPKPGSRSDPEFRWVVQTDYRWDKWRTQATNYLGMLRRGRTQALGALNAFLDYAQEHQVPHDPQDLFLNTNGSSYPIFQTGRSGDNARNALLKRFLEHVQDELRQDLIAQGLHHRASLLRLPIQIPEPTAIPAPTQSHRDPMPKHLVDLCLEILTEKDHAWPKSFMGRGDSDWITRVDPISGKPIRVWSPIRASVLIAKLMLPARTMQIRMLDSGEADTHRYDPRTRSWVANPNVLARQTQTEKGVFRGYPREDGSRGSLIYFNTNKTADINQPLHKRGHLMAWEHEEALTLFASVRDWQETFNPLASPTSWTDLGKQRSESPMDLAARGTACFLFRDPTEANPTLPISNGKIQTMWSRLMDEAEKRLAARGETRPDGSPIQLVLSRTQGRPGKLAYDLHSLRVTMITALYDSGVPVERLMKVAGHCATVMTLYYVKQSREKISLSLTAANKKRSLPQAVSSEWSEFLNRPKGLPQSLISEVSSTRMPSRSRVIFMDKGLCLSGGQCPPAASPGRSCAECVHFATGPAFLPGLQSECEVLFDAACKASDDYQKADVDIGRVRLAKAKGELCAEAKLEAVQAHLERCAAQVDELNRSFITTYAWAKQCLTLSSTATGLAVLLTSSQSAASILEPLGTSSDRTILALHQKALIYNVSIETPALKDLARLRFVNRILPAELTASGMMFRLGEDVRKAVSQQMQLWMEIRSGGSDRDALPDAFFGPLSKAWACKPQHVSTGSHFDRLEVA